jgi:carbamoyl-phosphate synthase small subunit
MKLIANNNINAVLCVADGSYFFGKGVGNIGEVIGEICFNTSITGYQEILTDPSYAGQIITFTFPHVGNVGCNIDDNEKSKPKCSGLIIREDITGDSNYRSECHLNSWLEQNGLTGICGVDTRALTKKIRVDGAKNVIIAFVENGAEIDTDKLIAKIADLPYLDGAELCSKVSAEKKYDWKNGFVYEPNSAAFDIVYNIAVIDYGVKENILRCLVEGGFKVTVFPAKSSYEDIMKQNIDGVFLSNGPGDPGETGKYAKAVIKKFLDNKVPVFGICMGHQLLSLAAGLKTVKMHQGHRGGNHPVKNLLKNTVEITSQNHGFCVENKDLPANIEVTHLSLFDGTIEGIRFKDKPAFSVQYHPESSPGPHDSRYLFEEFYNLIKEHKK